MNYLCESRWCLPPTGQHLDHDNPVDHNPACRGCTPALATDGLRLCQHCAHQLARDAFKTAALHRALGQRLAGRGRSTDTIGTVHRDPGYDLHPAIVDLRDDLRLVLVGLARLIAHERGIGQPAPDAAAIAAYIARNRDWLAAHPAAGEHAADLRDLATNRRAWAYAYPASQRGRILLGRCPLPVDQQPCRGRVTAAPTDTDVICPGCAHTDTIEGWWHLLNPGAQLVRLVDAYYAAQRLSAIHGRDIDPGTVRKWGQRTRTTGVAPARRISLIKGVPGDLVRDQRGRVLYPWPQLADHAAKLYAVDTAA